MLNIFKNVIYLCGMGMEDILTMAWFCKYDLFCKSNELGMNAKEYDS